MSRTWRRAGAILAAALVVELVVAAVLVSVRAPSGPPSSSYATGPRGVAAWAELLRDDGRRVESRRVPFDVEAPDPATTVVILDAVPSRVEVDVLAAFVAGGGRLVAGGERVEEWITPILGERPGRGRPVAACRALAAVPETEGVQVVESSGLRGFGSAGAALPILGCETSALAAVADVGAGRLVLLSDAAAVQEYLLGVRDNATFARRIVGEAGRPVVFAEHLHGFEASSGLAALPGRFRWALTLLAAAGACVLLSRAAIRRPVRHTEPPAGGSLIELDALTDRLARLPMGQGGEVLRAATDRAVRRRARLPAEGVRSEVAAAAIQLGCDPVDADVMRRSAATGDDLVGVARVLAAAARPPGAAGLRGGN